MKALFVGGPLDDMVVEVNDDQRSYTYENEEGNASYYGLFIMTDGSRMFIDRTLSYSGALQELAEKYIALRLSVAQQGEEAKTPVEASGSSKPKK